jgi:hypothetical protein
MWLQRGPDVHMQLYEYRQGAPSFQNTTACCTRFLIRILLKQVRDMYYKTDRDQTIEMKQESGYATLPPH